MSSAFLLKNRKPARKPAGEVRLLTEQSQKRNEHRPPSPCRVCQPSGRAVLTPCVVESVPASDIARYAGRQLRRSRDNYQAPTLPRVRETPCDGRRAFSLFTSMAEAT